MAFAKINDFYPKPGSSFIVSGPSSELCNEFRYLFFDNIKFTNSNMKCLKAARQP